MSDRERSEGVSEETMPGCKRKCGDCCECLSAHPTGKTCNDCAFVGRCKAMFGTKGDETFCQFVPRRSLFREPAA